MSEEVVEQKESGVEEPEWYLFLSLALSPIAGAIFTSIQLSRLKKGSHSLWVWPLTLLSMLWFLVFYDARLRLAAIIGTWIAIWAIYSFLKVKSKGMRLAKGATVFAVIFAVIEFFIVVR